MVVSNRYKSVHKEQGRECSPPSTFAPGLIPRVGVTCGLSLLLVLTLAQRVLLPVLNPTFHILIQSGNRVHLKSHCRNVCCKIPIIYHNYLILLFAPESPKTTLTLSVVSLEADTR